MEKYEFLSRTGEGAYGSVWRARDKNTGVLVAVKKMKDVPTTEEEGEIAMREVRVLQLAKHVNIVNLMEAYKSQSGRLYLVFEYVERTLLQELKANRSGLPQSTVKSITWQLLQALSYLHRKQIIHRDVKPSNILLTEAGVVKVCDFGFARACSNASADPAYTTYVVTRWYRPPEVLVGDTYGPPVDIWALGCIFAEMLAGRPLFPGKNHHDQLWLILKCLGSMTERQLDLLDADPQFACFRLPTSSEIEPLEQRLSGVGPSAMQVLRACLDPDPKHRASAEELLAMPYFQGVSAVLPLEDLSAYPDPDMRAGLERAVAQDQANAAAATAREQQRRRPVSPMKAAAPQQPLANTSGSSPTRQTAPQLSVPMPASKPAASAKLEPCCFDSQRPPLQRHITAPAGSMAARALGQTPLQPLQPLTDPYTHHQLSQQRSQLSSDGSQSSSPKGTQPGPAAATAAAMAAVTTTTAGSGVPSLAAAIAARGRSWRGSGDGSSGGVGGGGESLPTVRVPCGSNMGSHAQAAASNLSPGAPSSLPGLPVSDAGRAQAADMPAAAATRRPAHQRATWNGSSVARANAGGGSSSGGSSGSVGGAPTVSTSTTPPAQQAAAYLASSFNYHHCLPNDGPTVHRKSHSLAGNEALPPAASAPVGVRCPGVSQGGLPNRTLAPPLCPSAGGASNSAPAGIGAHLPPAQSASAGVHRLGPPLVPCGYSGSSLRSMNSMPLAPVGSSGAGACAGPAVSHQSTSRVLSQDGYQMGSAALGKQHPASVGPSAAAHAYGLPAQSANLDLEPSDGSVAEGSGGSGSCNDGRRASDTVLYAAVALKEAKSRIEKASQLLPGPSRSQPIGLLDPVVPTVISAGGASCGGAPSLSIPRATSFNRHMGIGAGGAMGIVNGPSSPEPALTANLPPLQITPQRRVSAPDSICFGVISSGGCGPVGSNCNAGGRGLAAALQLSSGLLCAQRHNLKPHAGSHQLGPATGLLLPAHMASEGDAAKGSSGGAAVQTFLPMLGGGHAAKGGRIVSAGTAAAVLGVARRPSKGSMRVLGPDMHCKREEATKVLLLEAVPEASVL